MKKIIFSLLIVAASVSVASAQTTWGVKAGFNYSTYKIGVEKASPSVNLGWKPGFYVGAVNNITLGRDWSLQTELQYSLDGTRLGLGSDLVGQFAEMISNGDFKYNKNLAASVCMHNLRLPVMIKFQPMGRLSVMAGPYISYRIGEKLNMNDNLKTLLEQTVLETSDLTISDIEDTAKDIIKDNVRKFDAGVAVGAEFKLCNGIFIDFRYSLSLLNSLTDKVKANGEEAPWSEVFGGLDIQPKMKYSALQIGLGYRF